MAKANKPGNGPRIADVSEDNDPLSTLGDPAGFPRILLYELRPFQIVQTTNQVLMFYMFEKVWRVIWTDGREIPKDPDPRWYGYSVGRWEDDYTFVVQSFGLECEVVFPRSEEHTSELQSPYDLVCRLLLEKKNSCSTSVSHSTYPCC